MKKQFLNKRIALGLIAGMIVTYLLRPILLTPYLLISVLIPIPFMIQLLTLISFLCGGLVTGYITRKSGWLYGLVVGILVSAVMLFSYWSEVKYSVSLQEISQYLTHAPVSITFDLSLIPVEIIASTAGGFIGQNLRRVKKTASQY